MLIEIPRDHGLIVWAKMSSKAESWAAMVVSTSKLDLIFEEKVEKTWVWWFGHNTLSQLKNNLIYEFTPDFKNHAKNVSGQRKNGLHEAIEILSVRYGIEIPQNIIRTDHLFLWAATNLEETTRNVIGKIKRNENYFIPNEIIEKIRSLNLKNIQLTIQQNVNDHLVLPRGQKRKNDVSHKYKKKYLYCVGCRMLLQDKYVEHPLFHAHLCENCSENIMYVILQLEKDDSNSVCCICFSDKSCLVVCNYCVRVYCKECLRIYCGQKGLDTIIREKYWRCFACNEGSCSVVIGEGLVRRTTKEQLNNIYNLYPAKMSDEVNKLNMFQEIHVLALKDEENIVTNILKSLQFPFSLLNYSDTSVIHDDTVEENIVNKCSSCIKLLVKCYPNFENYDEDEFNLHGTMEAFFDFLYVKNKFELRKTNSEPFFWAFESSASITMGEQKIISRFLNKPPILIGTNTKNVRQRGRFIWTNVNINVNELKHFKMKNICLREIHLEPDENEDLNQHWSYSSVKLILRTLIQNTT